MKSIEAVNAAADALSAACLKIQPSIARSLRCVWNEEVQRGLTADDLRLLGKLQ